METATRTNRIVDTNKDNWLSTFGRIEDKTKKNYFSQLPDESVLSKSIPKIFVINKPASSVGGNGYWLYEKEDTAFLAVFDCVGQGHLASMMTRIYSAALHKLVVENAIEFPGSILQFIHREIQSRFRDKENIILNTGADLGILKVNLAEEKMEFAGANMDLYQVTNGKLTIIKGDEEQIGEQFEHNHKYNTVAVDITSTTNSSKFYLCSGVLGLIGGNSRSKFGEDNFRRLLEANNQVPITRQKENINRHLKEWMGANPQNDDILLIGFSI